MKFPYSNILEGAYEQNIFIAAAKTRRGNVGQHDHCRARDGTDGYVIRAVIEWPICQRGSL